METDRKVLMRPSFVDVVPDPDLMEQGVLYVSIVYATAIHKCACGCGQQAVTPLSPDEWSLAYNGHTISLTPSIGNWGMECKSHYWIQGNRIIWVPDKKYSDLWSFLKRAIKHRFNRFRAPKSARDSHDRG